MDKSKNATETLETQNPARYDDHDEIDRLRAQNARLRFAVLFAFGWLAAERGAGAK